MSCSPRAPQFGLAGVAAFAGLVFAMTAMLIFDRCYGAGQMRSSHWSSCYFARAPFPSTTSPSACLLLFLLAVSLWVVERDRRRHDRLICFWPVDAVWVNLHGGFLALLACLGCLPRQRGGGVARAQRGRWADARRYGSQLSAARLAGNPMALSASAHRALSPSDWIREAVDEFQSRSSVLRTCSSLRFCF